MDPQVDLPTCGTNCVTPSLLRLFWFGQWFHFTETKLDKTEILCLLCLVEAPLSLPLCPFLGPFSSPERIYPGPLSYAHQVWLIFPSSPATASALVPQRQPWPCLVGALQWLFSCSLLKFKFVFVLFFCDVVSSRPVWSCTHNVAEDDFEFLILLFPSPNTQPSLPSQLTSLQLRT